ncbi:cache domain-containing protein [Patescibacteria group bacterium]
MWSIFWLKSLHFSLEFFVALATFAAAWIYLDSFIMEKRRFLPFKFVGFFFLATASVLHATGTTNSTVSMMVFIGNTLGLLILLAGFLSEPFQTKPQVKPMMAFFPMIWLSSLSQVPQAALINVILLAPLVVVTFIHATRGFQKQLRPLVLGFAFLVLAEAFEALHFLDKTSLLWLSNLLTPLGGVFIAEHLFKLLASVWILKYVWQYLPYRLNVELFLAFVSTTLAITLVITLTFTSLLLKSIEKEGLNHLGSDVRTLDLALKNLEAKTLSDARVISESSQVSSALEEEDQDQIQIILSEYLTSTKADFLSLINTEGRIIGNATDSHKIGQLINQDYSFQQALVGESISTAVEREGLIAPQVLIQSTTPIKVEEEVVAVVLTGNLIDNAFVDGVKTSTGLETTVFAQDTRAATTFLSIDGKSRRIGSKETNPNVIKTTLEDGEVFVGPTSNLNQPFYSAYLPFKSASEKVIGMLSVGMPQLVILESAEEAIQRTYQITALIILLSLIPAFWLAKVISYQMR